MDLPTSATSNSVTHQRHVDFPPESAIGDPWSRTDPSGFPNAGEEEQTNKSVWDEKKCCWGVVDCGEDDMSPADNGRTDA